MSTRKRALLLTYTVVGAALVAVGLSISSGLTQLIGIVLVVLALGLWAGPFIMRQR